MVVTLLKHREVAARVGLSPSKLYELVRAGRFPKPVKLGARTARYADVEVSSWIQTQLDARR